MTKVDKSGRFSFNGALDLESMVSCWSDAETEDDEWRYTHESGLEPNDVNIYGGSGGGCDDVKIVDDAGHPIADAQVSTFQDIDETMSEGLGNAQTNGAGIACVDGIGYGARLIVHAPAADGGECVGHLETKLTREQTAGQPLVVRLRARALPSGRARGRILGPEGLPVAHATINVSEVAPAATPDCTSAVQYGAQVETAADGTYALPPYPRGTLTISVQHDWYADADVQLANDGKPHDIVVKRKPIEKSATSPKATRTDSAARSRGR
jgi:hypothetical protein